jgi:hypothetical protein
MDLTGCRFYFFYMEGISYSMIKDRGYPLDTGGISGSSCNRPKTLFDIPCSIFCGSEKVLTKPIVTISKPW